VWKSVQLLENVPTLRSDKALFFKLLGFGISLACFCKPYKLYALQYQYRRTFFITTESDCSAVCYRF